MKIFQELGNFFLTKKNGLRQRQDGQIRQTGFLTSSQVI